MARARRPAARGRARPRPPRPRAPKPTPAEARLGALARELAALGRAPDALARAVDLLAAAWAPGGAVPRAVAAAFLATRGDKTATLALAWAREQVRLGLEEILARGDRPGAARPALPPDTLAWLVLAALEALAHEPPHAVPDRLASLRALIGLDAPVR
jgi:hypothetical protein